MFAIETHTFICMQNEEFSHDAEFLLPSFMICLSIPGTATRYVSVNLLEKGPTLAYWKQVLVAKTNLRFREKFNCCFNGRKSKIFLLPEFMFQFSSSFR
jgi:hypothetical protein